jgi:hypothetical protein
MSWNRGSGASAPPQPKTNPGDIAASAGVLGRMRLGANSTVSQGVVVRSLHDSVARLARLREGHLELTDDTAESVTGRHTAGARMGSLYAYKDKQPRVAGSAILFDSAEVTGDVAIGEETIIGAGVKIVRAAVSLSSARGSKTTWKLLVASAQWSDKSTGDRICRPGHCGATISRR